MAERIITEKMANYCQGGHVVSTLATHAVTDAKELPDGTWIETEPRYGCADHVVTSNVIYKTGLVISFDKYQKAHGDDNA